MNATNSMVTSDQTYRRPVKWSSYAQTDRGAVREVNEDSILSLADLSLWAVADGLGGHAVGDVASQMVTDSLALIKPKEYLNDMVNGAEDLLLDANSKIFEYSDIMLDRATMGSTVVSLLIHGQVGVCLWAGDSRLYRYRNNELTQLTRDHSQVEEWVQAGLLHPDDSQNHPQANIITRAIGVGERVDIDMTVFNTRIGDTFLLCSDGLYNAITQEQLETGLRHRHAEACVTELMDVALANKASDNVSIIVVKGEPGKL